VIQATRPTRRTVLRSAAGAAAVAPLAVLGVACGQEAASQPSKVAAATLRFAYSAEQNEIVHFDKIVEVVRQKVPQLTVTSEVYGAGTNAVHAQILVLWAAGTAPDITQISPNNIPSFVQKSTGLAVIDDLVKRDKHDVADFWPQAMPLSKWKQKLYTLPLGGGPNPFFFNPKHFREANIESPLSLDAKGEWTWDRFADVSKRLTVREGDAYKRAGNLVDLNFIRICSWIWSAGGDYFNADQTKCTLNQGASLDAMLWLYDLSAKQQVGPFAGAPAPGIRWFPEQTIATQIQPLTSMAAWRATDPTFEFDVVMNPKGKAGQFGLLNNWSLGMLASTKIKDAAWEFLKHSTGPDAILYYAGVGRAFPWRKSVATSKEFKDKQPLKSIDVAFKLGEKNGRTMPYNVPWIDIETIGNTTLNEVRDGKIAMREGLDRIAREADRLLSQQ
jgi:multiple sugar transport system substrate-binding protein